MPRNLNVMFVVMLCCAPLCAAPLALEYSVSGSSTPYTYNFRLTLDNHDGSWAPGQGWRGVSFGMSTAPATFATWQTDTSAYPVGPWNATYWTSSSGPSGSFSGPGFVNSPGPQLYWIPSTVGEFIQWSGTADVLIENGSQMIWLTSQGTLNGASYVWLEPTRRVGDWLDCAPVAASPVVVGPSFTGGGAGFSMGSFQFTSHDSASSLTSITLAASGSGDDATAFSEIGLFVDANANGSFDPGIDPRFGQVYSAYPSDNGSQTFNDALNFTPGQTQTLLIVAKLNGPAPAPGGRTFHTTVTAINASGGPHSGLPTAAINGVQIADWPFMAILRGATAIPSGSVDTVAGVNAGSPNSLTYAITNTGTAPLVLTGTPVVVVAAGVNISTLNVTSGPANVLAPSSSTSFTLEFTVPGQGAFDITISIAGNDPTQNPYTWSVAGTATSAPTGSTGDTPGGNDGGGCAGFPSPSTSPQSALLVVFALIALLKRRAGHRKA
ncbi:MAG: hypothetical protein IPP14_07045 [Planctomycetes bacterium]|nr:hypothetical protein [Planctomycetota bacterium]